MEYACPKCKKRIAAANPAASGVVVCPSCGVQLEAAPPPVEAQGDPADLPLLDLDKSNLPEALPADDSPGQEPRPPSNQPEDERFDETKGSRRLRLPADFAIPATLGRPRFVVEPPSFVLMVIAMGSIPLSLGAAGVVFFVFIGACFGVPLLIIFVLAAVLVTLFLRWWHRERQARVVVFTGGFTQDHGGGRVTVWHWSDVATFKVSRVEIRRMLYFVEMSRERHVNWVVQHRNGTRYRFDNGQGERAWQLGWLAERESFAHLYPAALAQLKAGKSVDFAPFQLGEKRLTYGTRRATWTELRRFMLHQGRFILPRLGTFGVAGIDNCHVLVAVLNDGRERDRLEASSS